MTQPRDAGMRAFCAAQRVCFVFQALLRHSGMPISISCLPSSRFLSLSCHYERAPARQRTPRDTNIATRSRASSTALMANTQASMDSMNSKNKNAAAARS